MKICTRCNLELPFESFRKRSDRKCGYQSQCKECAKKYSKPTKEKARKYKKTWIENNPDKWKEIKRNWHNKNADKINAATRQRRINNPEHIQILDTAAKHRRRARKNNNGYEFYTTKQVVDLYGINCHICNLEIDLTAPRKAGIVGWENGLQIDHIIAIANGGPDTLDNVRPAHGLCNLKKGAK
jgi:hypothetical protein